MGASGGYFGGDDGAGYGGGLSGPYLPGVGGGGGGGGYGGVGAAPPPTVGQGGTGPVVRFLPDWIPIPSSIEFNTLGQAASVAVENNVELAAAGFTLAATQLARIASVNLFVVNLTASSQLSFTIRINGANVDGWTNVAVFPGNTARLADNFGSYIRCPMGAKVQVFYTNADGGTYTVGAALSGWKWLDADGKRWLEQGI